MRKTSAAFLSVLMLAALIVACGGGGQSEQRSGEPRLEDDPQPVTEYVATAADFDCFLPEHQEDKPPQKRWYEVRNFFLKNLTGRTVKALDVVNQEVDEDVPVGTVAQLIFFEAMVKRGGDFCPEANGWEFFALEVSEGETRITSRGCTDVTNFAGGNCFECHSKAEPQYDLICESGHGCDPLSIDAGTIERFQESDPRCVQ